MPSVDAEITIVLADDDEDDRFLLRRAVSATSPGCDLRCVKDGAELLEFLRHEKRYQDARRAPRPDLILLDLNMPCQDGRQALTEIKGDPELRSIPVVVLTTSNSPQDVRCCYALGANSYIVKPRSLDELLDVIHRVIDYWAELVVLPSREEQAASQ